MWFFCGVINDSEFATFTKFAWEFLARVNAEAVPLEKGTGEDEVELPGGRRSGVYRTKIAFVYDGCGGRSDPEELF